MKKLKPKNDMWNNEFVKKHTSLVIILFYNIIAILGAILLYFLVPILLNYPPGFAEIAKKYSLSYFEQFVLLAFFFILVVSIFYSIVLKGISKWASIKDNTIEQLHEIRTIRRKCLNLPYLIYIAQIAIPIIIFIIVFPFIATFNVLPFYLIVKIIIVIFSITSLTSIISFIFSRRVFAEILFKTKISPDVEGIRIKLRDKIFLQIVPMIIVSILFGSLIVYSKLIEEKGNLLYKLYKTQLIKIFNRPTIILNEEQIKRLLNKVKLENNNGCTFIVTPQKQISTANGIPLNKIFTIYLFDYFSKYNGHIYDKTKETQGVAIKLKGIDGEYIVGVKYEKVYVLIFNLTFR